MKTNDDNTHTMRIGEISKLYGVSIPTLRYWESEGLFKANRTENNYRLYKLYTVIIDVGDTIFYRNLDFSIENIRQIQKMGRSELKNTLCKAKDTISEKLENLKSKMALLEERLRIIDEINTENFELWEADVPFYRVVEFDYNNSEHFKRYLENPQCFISINSPSGKMIDDINGIAVEKDFVGKTIFEKKPSDRFMMSYCKHPLDSFRYENISELTAKLEQMGLSPDMYILLFLISMVDDSGAQCDYYRIWFRIQNK